MRAGLLILFAIFVLVTWWAAKVQDSEPIVDEPSRGTPAGPSLTDVDRPVVSDSIATSRPSGSDQAGDQQVSGNIPGNLTNTVPSRRTADPRLRTQYIEYLIQSGLSDADSQRIADSALTELGDCLNKVYSGSEDLVEKSISFPACNLGVLQEHGLTEAMNRLE